MKILFLLLVSFNAYGACLDDALTTVGMSDCYIAELKVEEQKLDGVLNKAYKKSDWIIKEIIQSQKDWLKYRESHCRAMYASYGNGTMRLIAHPACMVELTKERKSQIRINFIEN